MSHTMKKNISRLAACFLAFFLVFGTLPTVWAAETSGTCGNGLTWSFADGRLTITGSGDMTDYNSWNLPPWYEYREQIRYLSLPEGLTSVGDCAFYDCVNLTSVKLPSTVTDVGQMAFCQNRSLTILNFNSGLKSIGRSAFELCESLKDIRLPNTLTSLGYHAFYRCVALRYINIPASVVEMDSGVFAYCSGLIGASIEASLEVIPAWTFYGCTSLYSVALTEATADSKSNAFSDCDNLRVVYYPGPEEKAEQLQASIGEDQPVFSQSGYISNETPTKSNTAVNAEISENGDITVESSTVIVTENTTITTTTENASTESQKTAEVTVDATIVNPEGWTDVVDAVFDALSNQQQREEEGAVTGTVMVNGYLTGEETVPEDVLQKFSGMDVSITVHTGSGAQFTINGADLDDWELSDGLNLSYALSRFTDTDNTELNGATAYTLKFSATSTVNARVSIRLDAAHARKTITLYQVEGRKLAALQSVVADAKGIAHFFLGAVDADTEYILGVDVQDIDKDTVIVPEELHEEYGVTNTTSKVEYVITGRKSSWGMNIGQVTWILAGVMLVCVAVIGVVMYVLNKRKLKMGYIPDVYDED